MWEKKRWRRRRRRRLRRSLYRVVLKVGLFSSFLPLSAYLFCDGIWDEFTAEARLAARIKRRRRRRKNRILECLLFLLPLS